MIVSYPIVNSRGIPDGREATFCFKDIVAIENMTRHVRRPHNGLDHDVEVEQWETVPNCVMVHLRGSCMLEIQADYAVLKAMMQSLGEIDE